MDENQWQADRFEEHRAHLRAVAYRMLGSLTEADDAVQDAWLRLSRADASNVENLGGWLTTIVARVCLNMLRARKHRRRCAARRPWPGGRSCLRPVPGPRRRRRGMQPPESWRGVPDGQPLSVMAFTIPDGRIVEIDVLADPERLQQLDPGMRTWKAIASLAAVEPAITLASGS
jgi:DNA-directed RNA polymerase specialized sigma24 family protein